MQIGVGIGIGIGRDRMTFGHEKLDVHRAAIEYVGWAYRCCEELKGHRAGTDDADSDTDPDVDANTGQE